MTRKRKTTQQPYKVQYGENEGRFEDTKCDLLSKRAAISGEITTNLRDIGHLEYEIERITKEIAETGMDLEL